MTPDLVSPRLLLRGYRASLVTQQHVGWLNDPEVVKYSEQRHKRHTEASQRTYLNSFGEHDHIWLMHDGSKKADIGTITAYVDPYNKIADMGILIGMHSYTGQGYATEVWGTVMDWLFKEKDVRKIECGTVLDNRAMRQVAVKNKMTCEAVRPQHFLLGGEPQDLLLYGRIRP